MFDRKAIYTHADGRPIEGRPDPLPEGATIDEIFKHERAWHRYEDRVRDAALRAFSKQFRRSLRETGVL